MAGKHQQPLLTDPPLYPGSKKDKAYHEGRLGIPATNPHPVGSPAWVSYVAGVSGRASPEGQIQTAVQAVEPPPLGESIEPPGCSCCGCTNCSCTP